MCKKIFLKVDELEKQMKLRTPSRQTIVCLFIFSAETKINRKVDEIFGLVLVHTEQKKKNGGDCKGFILNYGNAHVPQ